MRNIDEVLPFDDGNFAIRFSCVVNGNGGIRWKSHPGPPEAAFVFGKTIKQPHETVSVWGQLVNGKQVCAFDEASPE